MAIFGDRLRFLREEKDLSQEELGKIINSAKSTISQYELGKRNPDPATLLQFADFFNVSTDYLLGRTDRRELLSKTEQNTKIKMDEEIDLDSLQIAAHDESGKPVPASEGLKNLIREVIKEVRKEKLLNDSEK